MQMSFADDWLHTAIAFLVWGTLDRLTGVTTDLLMAGVFLIVLSAITFVIEKIWRAS